MRRGRRLGTLAAALGAVLLAGVARADRPRAIVVRSSDLAAYEQVVAGFGSALRMDLSQVTLTGDTAQQEKLFREVAQAQPAVVLAVGPAAALGAQRWLPHVPVIFCMVPYYQRYALEGSNMTGIALTSDLSLELSALRRVFPHLSDVGVLYDPRYSAEAVQKAQHLAAIAGLRLVPFKVESASEAQEALGRAKGRAQALVMIADKTVASAEVIRKEIAFGREQRIPVVGFAASQVKAGATLSFAPSYSDIGLQAGRLANRLVFEKIDPGALAVVQPEVLDLSLNLGSAQKLGPSGEVLQGLLRFAAKQGFPVRVFP